MRFFLGFEIGSIIHEFLNFFLLPAYLITTFLLMDHLKLKISMWERQYDYDEDFRNRFYAKKSNRSYKLENVKRGRAKHMIEFIPKWEYTAPIFDATSKLIQEVLSERWNRSSMLE